MSPHLRPEIPHHPHTDEDDEVRRMCARSSRFKNVFVQLLCQTLHPLILIFIIRMNIIQTLFLRLFGPDQIHFLFKNALRAPKSPFFIFIPCFSSNYFVPDTSSSLILIYRMIIQTYFIHLHLILFILPLLFLSSFIIIRMIIVLLPPPIWF